MEDLVASPVFVQRHPLPSEALEGGDQLVKDGGPGQVGPVPPGAPSGSP